MTVVPFPDQTSPVSVDIAIEAGDWGDEETLRPTVERILATALRVGRFDLPAVCEVSLLLTDDAHIRALNRTWRGKDKPTNVLSFPAEDFDETAGEAEAEDPARPTLLGDIVIARETLVREAGDEAKSVDDHFCHLLVHGLMHLLGYDHETDHEAEEMEALETEILGHLGVDDPYADEEA